ncbi:MAG TPA: formyltransferase family protein [Dehalococcoidia bacterium]|nr:formyltransferase family protein [Dehalococcoidia bacterium]
MSLLRLGWFTTGRGAGSFGLLKAVQESIESGRIAAQIVVLFSNRERGEAAPTDELFDYAEGKSIPVVSVSSVGFRKKAGGQRSRPGEPLPAWRAQYDEAVAAALAGHDFDLGVLGGYMLITTPEFCQRYPLLNLHPAAPGGPKGTWQEVIWQLIEDRATESGVSTHVVTPQLDEGPIVSFCRYSLRLPEWDILNAQEVSELRTAYGDDLPLFKAIRELGFRRELPLILETLRAAGERRFTVQPGIALDPQDAPLQPLDLTDVVEQTLHPAITSRR